MQKNIKRKTSIHQQIIKEIVTEKRKDSSVVAILIFGSVAKGLEKPTSDVDIEIISSKAKKNYMLKKKRYGITVDIEIWPKKRLVETTKKRPYLKWAYLQEKIVYDQTEFMKKYVSRLRKYFKKHPGLVKFWKEKDRKLRKAKQRGTKAEDYKKVYAEASRKFWRTRKDY